jgi:serine/threonine-protein kinase
VSFQFTCPHGHHWQADDTEMAGTAAPTLVCPVCGAASTSDQAPHRAETWDGIRDELPPAPNPVRGPPGPLGATGESAAPPPTIAGYEILEEVGRGGMGVVYRAGQRGLSRTVALKVILAGAHAGPHERARFRTEAEAVARLQHPHIVQIHELGEQAGCPYLALEYVDGVSLAQQLGGTPQPPRAAAQLVETLARAVHHAHERGVVHRDLTPANVLLTSDGTPKITDFGLAKLVLGGGAGQTQTGAVMGTPSYMAPEQAAGRSKEIGPAVDIYALGAILYELLTGRPPFKAASSLETVQQVLLDEPVPPVRLQPRLPRDLETICLKCLQKGPRQRYASALALADDLRRFLGGEPIQARPVSPLGRLARWCRRHPKEAGLAAALAVALLSGLAGVTWQWRQAEQRRNEAEKNYHLARRVVSDYFASLSGDPLLDHPGSLPLRKDLLETALTHFQDLRRQQAADPDLQIHLARCCYCLAQIRTYTNLTDEAVILYEDAIAVQQGLVREYPDVVRFQRDLARSYAGLGSVLAIAKQFARAHECQQQALAIRERLHQADPADPEFRRDLASSYAAIGYRHHAEGVRNSPTGSPKGLPFLQQARDILEQLVHERPDDLANHSALSGTLNVLGLNLSVLGRSEEALAVYQAAIRRQQPVFAQARQAARYRHLISVHYFNMGYYVLIRLNRPVEAADAARMSRKLNAEDPDNLWRAARLLAVAADTLGKGQKDLSVEERALRSRFADEAVEMLQDAVGYGLKDVNSLSLPDFAPLRSRADFKQLVTGLKEKAKVEAK